MSEEFHPFKELLEAFLAQEPAGSLSAASLLYYWLKQPAPNVLAEMLVSQNVELDPFKGDLEAMVQRPHSNGDPWILQYISQTKDLDAVSTFMFLRDCISASSGALRGLFEEYAVNPDEIVLQCEAEKRQRVLTIIQENAAQAPKHLARNGRDLLECARRGEFEGLVKRSPAFEQMLNILRKSRKGNVIITGPAGAGKTALVEYLANELAGGVLEATFPRIKLFEVRMSSLLAGTQYRGMFEERLEQVITEVELCKPVILFIDEVHLLWGAGRTSESAMDAANILKPHLARGDLRVIGATTSEDYRRYILRDPALARRFEEIKLTEPDADLTCRMIERQIDTLARSHGVNFETGCIGEAIDLTNRFLPNRQQPDKTIDLLDTIAAKITAGGRIQIWKKDLREAFGPMGGKVSHSSDLASEARNLTEQLSQKTLGQINVVETVSRTFAMRKLMDNTQILRPLSFLFAGGSGVGKTSLAKSIATVFFGDAKQCLHLDLGEYNSSLSVTKILGSPGLSGMGEHGLLPTFLDAHPEGVLLFDEIEKAHPDIMDMALGLLDHGTVTTASGYRLDARGCVFIATTNVLQSDDLSKNPIGFSIDSREIDPREALGEHFRVEFLNRFDDVLIFENLDDEALSCIIREELNTYANLVGNTETETIVQIILKQLGSRRDARAAKRAIRKAVETLLMASHYQAVS